MADLFGYFDYRKFLSDLLAEKRAGGRIGYSLRGLAKRTGIDPSYFSKVLQGTRNITAEQIVRFAEVLRFDKPQSDYFELLVMFCQSRSHDMQRHYFEKLIALKRIPRATPLAREQYEFYSKWYYTVIRELLHFAPKTDDYKMLAKMLVPSIKSSQAREAISLLEKIGLIRPASQGGYELVDAFITAGPEIKAFAIKNFQVAMMEIAKDALANVPPAKREISTLTLSLSHDGFDEVMRSIREFRKKLMEIAQNDNAISGVYEVNIQAFPVTRADTRDLDNEI